MLLIYWKYSLYSFAEEKNLEKDYNNFSVQWRINEMNIYDIIDDCNNFAAILTIAAQYET